MRILWFHLCFLGCLLTSITTVAQDSEYGVASYYADDFHGSKTYSGERYNKSELTAGHKTLPMGSVVRVTRMDNKKYVDVRINDRGPYFKGRIIDLSGRAADALGLRKDGATQVKLDVVGKNGTIPKNTTSKPKKKTPVATTNTSTRKTPTKKATTATRKTSPAAKSTTRSTPKAATSKTTKRKEVYTAKGGTSNSSGGASYKEKLVPDAGFEMVVPKNYSKYGLYSIELQRPKRAGYGVQVASFSNYENVMKQVADLQGKWFNNILVSIEPTADGQPIYKVILGPFSDLSAAKNYRKNAAKKGVKGFVTTLGE